MARRRKDDDLWNGLVALPALMGFAIGWEATHSFTDAAICAGAGIGIGIGGLIVWAMGQHERLKRSGINEVDKMTGRQFEKFLGYLFKSLGYSVEVTRESGDYGADLVLQQVNGMRIVVQAKCYKGNVGLKAVQEAQASIAYYHAHEAWVVTNSGYTDQALILAKSNNVRLIARKELIELILQAKSGTAKATAGHSNQIVTASNPQTPTSSRVQRQQITCDKCGRPMVLKRTSLGLNYICRGFPACKNIKSVLGQQ